MRQKNIFSVFLIIISCMFTQAYAQTVEVYSLDNFSTESPPQSISVKLLEPLEISEKEIYKAGTIMKGDLFDVVSPKRLKRDAGFSFKPDSYTDLDGNTYQISSNITASYTTPMDKGQLAKNTALTVGNFFVKGLSMGVSAVSGAVKNEEGNRLKSSAVSVYESSPFSYIEKGEDINITQEQTFFLKFSKTDDKEDISSSNEVQKKDVDNEEVIQGQNYTFQIEKE